MPTQQLSWFAEYKDKSRFPQLTEDGKTERSYDDIPNRDQITAFCLFNRETKQPVLTLHLDEDQKLVYRRRVFKTEGGTENPFYLVGWRKTVAGECIQSIAYVHEATGYVQFAGKFQEGHVLFDSPVLRDFEKVAGE